MPRCKTRLQKNHLEQLIYLSVLTCNLADSLLALRVEREREGEKFSLNNSVRNETGYGNNFGTNRCMVACRHGELSEGSRSKVLHHGRNWDLRAWKNENKLSSLRKSNLAGGERALSRAGFSEPFLLPFLALLRDRATNTFSSSWETWKIGRPQGRKQNLLAHKKVFRSRPREK